jgi:hypothetical protein
MSSLFRLEYFFIRMPGVRVPGYFSVPILENKAAVPVPECCTSNWAICTHSTASSGDNNLPGIDLKFLEKQTKSIITFLILQSLCT